MANLPGDYFSCGLLLLLAPSPGAVSSIGGLISWWLFLLVAHSPGGSFSAGGSFLRCVLPLVAPSPRPCVVAHPLGSKQYQLLAKSVENATESPVANAT